MSYGKKKKSKVTIFIDESGTLPDPKDKVIIVAAVGTDVPRILVEVTKKVRKKIRARKTTKEISEIKFYNAGEKTKQIYLEELSKRPIDIFALVIEKKNQKIPDSPENFATLSYILLEECQLFYRDQIKEIIFDKHFHRVIDQDNFNRILFSLLDRKFSVTHVDSIKDLRVNVADMVAGSFLWKYTGKNEKFYELIKENIISERILNWKIAKGKFFKKK